MPSIDPRAASGGDVVHGPEERPPRCTKCTPQRHTITEPRNLVVCIDGTSSKFGRKNTNIVKLFAKIDLDPEDSALPRQRAYYSSGLGTRPKAWHAVSRFQRSFSDLLDKAVAWNVEEIVQDAYGWLANEYREGDHIYLFGCAQQERQVGLIKSVTDKQIATYRAYEHYMAVRSRKLHAKDVTSAFKHTFCWKDIKVHFIGVWDTVSSVGFVKEDVFLSSSSSAEHACHFRHALALDEQRVKFIPEYFQEMNTRTDNLKPDNTQNETSLRIPDETLGVVDEEEPIATDDNRPEATNVESAGPAGGNSGISQISNIKEVWFAGSHADVGGANSPGKSFHAGNVSLMWMRHEAAECGLLLKPTDIVWTPVDLDYGTSNSLSLRWKILELFPVKHQVSWWHLSEPRRIIPGQKIHASVLFANTYRPKAHLGEGFVFPAGWPSTSGDELDDEKWEKVLFDYTAVRELFGRLQSSQTVPLRYLDRLLFVLRFEEGKNCVRGVDRWQETFEKIIHGDSEAIVKLVAIVAFYEASVDEVTLSEDVLNNARTCLQDILPRRSNQNFRRALALLRPLADHTALREDILTADVIKIFMGLLDDVLRYPEADFGQTMDALASLLKYGRKRLTASLRVILPFARTERGRKVCRNCQVLTPRLRYLAQNHQGRVGLLAVETLLELYEEANTEAEQHALTERLLNGTFRANLAHVFNLFSGADDRNLSGNYDGHARSGVLRRLFGLGDGNVICSDALKTPDEQALQSTQKELIRHLQLAIAESNASERTAATLTLLKLCEGKTNSKLRKHLLDEKITDAFIEQLKDRDSSLLGAHALTTCMQYVCHHLLKDALEDMKQPILSNDNVLKHIVKMLRLDSFDDAVGQIEGWRIFANLMRELIRDGNAYPKPNFYPHVHVNETDDLKRKMEGEDSEITKVLEEKLIRGKPKDIRTSLLSLEILRSLGEHPHEGDFWTEGL
ncbi:hypothetical protein BDN67DRAFT_985910, partial [Paxillus ammoniavirescens]